MNLPKGPTDLFALLLPAIFWCSGPAEAPAQTADCGPVWRYAAVTGTAGASARLRILLRVGGEAYLDDLTLVPGALPEVGVNLIRNGGFESTFPGSDYVVTANYSNSAVSAAVKHSGAASLHLIGLAGGSSDVNIIYQDLAPSLTNGKSYTLSFWYLPGTNTNSLSIRLASSTIGAEVALARTLTDNFGCSANLSGSNVAMIGSTMEASKEPAEPNHAGNSGGKSVWCSWLAPASGAVTISTAGSSFDTLLGVYQGTSLTNLNLLASNDNNGTNLTSSVSFNAISNVTYHIAVDGRDGASGTVSVQLSFQSGQVLFSSTPRSDGWSAGNPIWTLLETNGTIYIGGGFGKIGPPPGSGTGAMVDLFSGLSDPTFPRINGVVFAVEPDGAGGWYVGGEFTSVGGLPRTNLARILNDNRVDPSWNPAPNRDVGALAVADNKVYVGGFFTSIGGQARNCLALLDGGTGDVLGWDPDVHYAPVPVVASVRAIVLFGTNVYVGGLFSSIGGQTRNGVAALSAATGLPTPWNPPSGENSIQIDALKRSGDLVYVGGIFTNISGLPRQNIAALDAQTGAATDWNPDADEAVDSLEIFCNTVYAGGEFTYIGGRTRIGLAALDPLSGTATDWNPRADDTVAGLRVLANTIYVAGAFQNIGGQHRNSLAAVDLTTGKATTWAPDGDTFILGFAIAGNKVFASGTTGGADVSRTRVAAFDARTLKPKAWNPRADGDVYAMAYSSNTIYLGGLFTKVVGPPRYGLAAVDAVTAEVKPWHADLDYDGDYVLALALSGNTLYVGGDFSSIGGQTRFGVAAVDATTGAVLSWNPGANNSVFSLAVSGTTLYMAGAFSTVGGVSRNHFAAVDTRTGFPTAWNPDALDGSIGWDIRPVGSVVYVAGDFTLIGGQARTGLAALDLGATLFTNWNPNPSGFLGLPPTSVTSVRAVGNTVYAAGQFTRIGNQPRNFLAALDSSNGTANDWNPQIITYSFDAPVFSLEVSRTAAYAGGDFVGVAGRFATYFAAFAPIGAPVFIEPPQNQIISAGQILSLSAVVSGHGPLAYQWQFNGADLAGATNRTLEILNAQANHSGIYTLAVTNLLGYVSADARVIVVEPLVLTAQPQSQSGLPGASVTLSVSVTGNPPPLYQWRLNGVNIPGAVYSTLVLTNVQATNGGTYTVFAFNGYSSVESQLAELRVSVPSLPYADNFADRAGISGSSGVGAGNNAAATPEPGEPRHAAKTGGHSLWLSWVAPVSGIALFHTAGSAFDTLLAVYTNSVVNGTNLVAADDDRGGFLTSLVAFNAAGGTEYQIAVDGYYGATGKVVLSWSLQPTNATLPSIIVGPQSQTVGRGVDITFTVIASSPTPLGYQWFYDCTAIPDATNSFLVLTNVQASQVGVYAVQVNNAFRGVESLPAFLEFGSQPKVISYDKLEDLFQADSGGGVFFAALKGRVPRESSAPGAFVSVAAGTIGAQLLANTGAGTQLGETNHCGVFGGSSKWFGLQPVDDGVLVVDTIGSGIDTVLAVYTGTNLFSLAWVACDNNSAPDGIRSLVRFQGARNTKYNVAVDGINGAQGNINLNWRLGAMPGFVPQATANPTIRLGGSLVLSVTVTNGLPSPVFQWRWNGRNISGATNATLNLNNLQPSQAGTYSVVASNFVGAVTSTVANVTVALPIQVTYEMTNNNGSVRFRLMGPASTGLMVEASGDLMNWTPLYTNAAASLPLNFTDFPATNSPLRFYRVTPWR